LLLALIAALLVQTEQDPDKPTPQPIEPEKKVVVTGTRHTSDPLDVPSSMTIIDRAEIEKSNAHTIVDVLKARPGLMIQKFSSTPQDAIIDARGFVDGSGAGLRTMVLIDGRKINNAATNSVDWAAIPLDNIERIEIVRGPAASMYGDGALAAVVNIITKRPAGKITGTGGIEAGSFDTRRETALYSMPAGPIGAIVFASHTSSDGFRDNSAFDGLDASATVDWAVGPGTAWIKLAYHNDNRERPGTLTKAEIATLGRDGSVTVGDESDVRTKSIDLGGEWELGGGTLSPLLTFTRDGNNSLITGFNGTFTSHDDSDQMGLGLRYVRTFGAILLVTGIDASIETATAASVFNSPGFDSTSDADYDRTIVGVYARAEWRVIERLLLSASLRYDRASIDFERTTADTFTPATTLDGSKDFSHVAPMLGWTFALTPGTTLYASAGKTVRFPNRDELVGFLATALDLDPERARVYELGARSREWAMLGGSISFYWMDVHDQVFFNPPAYGEDVSATFNFGQNVNLDDVRHRGVELELTSTPEERFELFGNLTVQRTEVLRGAHEGEEMPLTPMVAALVGVRYLVLEGLTAQAAVRYTGERYLTNDIENGSDPLDDYGVLDVKFGYRGKTVSAFLSVDNVLGKETFDSGGLRIPFGVFPGQQAFSPAAGRSFLFGASITF